MGAGQIPLGATQGQVRPLTVVEALVSVTPAQTVLHAANPARRNLIVQNLDADPLRIYTTTGGSGGITIQQYQTWESFQDGVGGYQGAVYGIYGSATANVSVIEET